MPKDYEQYRLPVRMPSEANDKAMTTSLTVVKRNTNASDQNRDNSFENPGNSAAHNSGSMRRTSTMANANLAAVKYESRFAKKSRNVTRTLLVKKALETGLSNRNHGNISQIVKAIANWTWQDTFEMIVMFGIVDVCMMGMYCTTAFIKGLILLLG